MSRNPRERAGHAIRGVAALIALGLSGLLGACRSFQTPAVRLEPGLLPSQARVTDVRGSEARGRNPDAAWRKLRLGDWLAMGATVQTGPSTTLTLQLYEAGVLMQVKPDSLLVLEKLSYRNDAGRLVTATVIDLQRGEVAVDDSRLPPGSEFTIRTPGGLTRIPPR